MENSSKAAKTKYEFGPITEKDNIVSVHGLGDTHTDMLIVEHYEERLSSLQNGILPDPRIIIPQMQAMDVFDDDIFICAFMKCGTHWVWEMCQMLIKGKADYHKVSKESCMMEFHFADEFKDVPKPRVFNTHVTPNCLPSQIFDKQSKIIHLQRNPKDIITSTYHHMKLTALSMDATTTWEKFLSEYVLNNDRDVHTNWFYYTKTWEDFVDLHKDRILVLQYEGLKQNTKECLKKLAEFLGYPRNDELYQEIADKCSLSSMKQMEKERKTGTDIVSSAQVSSLYRKGVVGDWKNHFTVAQSEEFDSLLKKNGLYKE